MVDKWSHNLPPFRRDHPFPLPSDADAWRAADGTLKQLAQSLRIEGDTLFRDEDEPVRAIPDPWAQARTFGEALLDPSHSQHRTALSQWRGLLALFALQHRRRADYTLFPHPAALGDRHIFDRVLKHLSPRIALHGQITLWETPWLIQLQRTGQGDATLAMTNPICLVSPGRRSLAIDIPGVAWAGGDLRDPLTLPEAEALSVTELILLDVWLRQTAKAVGPGDPVSARICDLLSDFAAQCRAAAGQTLLETDTGDSLYSDLPELYRPLWARVTLRPVANPAATSRTRLRLKRLPDEARADALKGVILVDESLCTSSGLSPRHTFVWGERTLGEVLASDNLFARVRDEAAKAGYLLVRAADLFTERAVRLAKEPLIPSHPQAMQDMLLPLRPLTLLLEGDPTRLISAETADNRVSVTLQVRLDDGSESGTAHGLTRHYATTPVSGQGLLVTNGDWSIYNASLWPDFVSAAWSSYLARFTYSTERRNVMVRPHQAISAHLIAAELRECPDAAETVTRLLGLNGSLGPARLLTEQAGRLLRSEKTTRNEYEEIQYSTLGFEAITYYDCDPVRGDAMAGMVLAGLEQKHVSPRDTPVAVDFGTTNTVACFRDLQPVRFQKRLVQPIVFKNPETTRNLNHAQRWHFSKFLPLEERPTPTPTVALTRRADLTGDAFWAFRNIIYFHSLQRHAAHTEATELEQFGRVAQDAKFNLKWSHEAAHVEATRDFLAQFMTMIAVEAAARGHDPRRLVWRFSVPDSMGVTAQRKFKDNLDRIARTLSAADADQEVVRPLYSEGLAAASYILRDAGFNPGSLNFILDIGGGTTDVTIWKFRELIWKGSFQIAGQNFFTRAISQNPHILRPIGLEHWHSLFTDEKDNQADSYAAQLSEKDKPHLAELLFSSDSLQQAIDNNWEAKLNLDVGQDLRLTALVFLGGLAWYLGLVTRHLMDTGVLNEADLASPSFALCGRGAGLFKKMHGRRATYEGSDVTTVLSVFSSAVGTMPGRSPQFFTTPDAKLEVVRGMMADSSPPGEAMRDGDYPSGLSLRFQGGGALIPEQLISAEAFTGQVSQADLTGLTRFLSALENDAGIRLNLMPDSPQGAQAHIDTALRSRIEATLSGNNASLRLEAPFITALRALVDEMAGPLETRDKARSRQHRLRMEFTS